MSCHVKEFCVFFSIGDGREKDEDRSLGDGDRRGGVTVRGAGEDHWLQEKQFMSWSRVVLTPSNNGALKGVVQGKQRMSSILSSIVVRHDGWMTVDLLMS